VARRWGRMRRVGGFSEEVSRETLTTMWVDGVVFDQQAGVFRMWYACAGLAVCTRVSRDAVHWENATVCEISGGIDQVHQQQEGNYTRQARSDSENDTHLRLPFLRESGSVMPHPDKSGVYIGAWYQYDNFHKTPDGPLHQFHKLRDGRILTFLSSKESSGQRFYWTGMATSPVSDAGTTFYNPFRRRFVFCLKHSFMGWIRVRRYYEVDSLEKFQSFANINRCARGIPSHKTNQAKFWFKPHCLNPPRSESVFWLSADAVDGDYDHRIWAQLYPKKGRDDPDDVRRLIAFPRVRDLYLFFAAAYQSVMIGVGHVTHAASMGKPKDLRPNIFFSRDGFHMQRPPREFRATNGDHLTDIDLVQRADVVCGALSEGRNGEVYMYCTSIPLRVPEDIFNSSWRWPTTGTIDVFQLRQDGFAWLEPGRGTEAVKTEGREIGISDDGSEPRILTTRLLTASNAGLLRVNVELPGPEDTLVIQIFRRDSLDLTDQSQSRTPSSREEQVLAACTSATLHGPLNNTVQIVPWGDAVSETLCGNVDEFRLLMERGARIRFIFGGTGVRLYSFTVAHDE
jgi:hypothetical protein